MHKFALTHGLKSFHAFEYLGPNNLSITDNYQIYLQKSAEFLSKAKKFKQSNLNSKNSVLHQNKFGYINLEDFEENILEERKKHMEFFEKIYDVTAFDEDTMYKNFNGKGKRIRIIRDEKRPKAQEFSNSFYKETKSWFTNYCILSKFIQTARLIIIKNRLNKALQKLKQLTPLAVEKFEKETQEGTIKNIIKKS